MTYTISPDGWVSGSLPGPHGVLYPVEHHECPRPPIHGKTQPYRRLEKTPPDLCLHTTEGTDLDSAISTLRSKFSPPQWATGEDRIAQLRPLWAQGASVDTQNGYLMQIEMVTKSQLTLWLPQPETLNPTVGLVAFLHREHIITTGLARPKPLEGLPLVLDKGPQANDQYYRRFLAPEPQFDGVRGHVDMRDDEHYDPGSFNYPDFFAMVWACIQEGDDDVALTDEEKAALAFVNANADGFAVLLDIARGLDTAGNPAATTAGKGATRARQVGFRLGRENKVQEAGGHGG